MVLTFSAGLVDTGQFRQTKEDRIDFQAVVVSEGVKFVTPTTWPPPSCPEIKITIDPSRIDNHS
jgi:hypothetical protein